MKRFGIYTNVTPSQKGGVGRQLDGLLSTLPKIDTNNKYFFFADRAFHVEENIELVNCPVSAEQSFKNHVYESLVVPRKSILLKLDVLHVPNTMPIFYKTVPTIITIYDLAEFTLNYRVYDTVRHYYRKTINFLAARRSSLVITTSQSTKSDIVHYLGIQPEKIHVIYPGVGSEFLTDNISESDKNSVKQKYNLPENYILFVGQIQPRKNLLTLIRSFAKVNQSHTEVKLVIVGKKGWMYDEIYKEINTLGLVEQVHFTGFVPDEDLPAIYTMAHIFIFPSLYEGFGFPVVEAMKCGTPVITSNNSSLAEITGDAGILVNPISVDDLANAIDSCLENVRLREVLSRKGKKRASKFTWERCAKQTVELYEYISE